MYIPSKPFTCLDGSLTVPFEFVNDDYCDCQGKPVRISILSNLDIIYLRW